MMGSHRRCLCLCLGIHPKTYLIHYIKKGIDRVTQVSGRASHWWSLLFRHNQRIHKSVR